MTYNLRLGVLPSPEEAIRIRTFIGERERKSKSVEQQILRLRENVESLENRKENIRVQLESRRAYIAPIRRLHPEILQEIFKHCLPVAHNAIMCNREAPLLLGQICSYWRRLAAESPELWASINIVIPPNLAPPFTSLQKTPPLQEISTWLCRSGALPLSISLYSTYSPVTPTEALDSIHAPYIDVLAVHKSRWKSIWISIPTYNWPNHFFSRFSARDVPLLEQIHIQGPRTLDSPPLLNSPTFDLRTLSKEDSILCASRLRAISVLPVGPELLQLSLHWDSITELNLSWNIYRYPEIVRALQLCRNLEACVISSVDPRSSSGEGITDISLPKLQYLSIIDESDSESDISLLLKGLHAPNLRHLAYERKPHWPPQGDEGYYLEGTIEGLSIFLKRLIHPLEEMELTTDSILQHDVMQILSLVPGVKRLALKGTGRPIDTSRAIPYHPLAPVFLFREKELRKLTPGRVGYVPLTRRRRRHSLTSDEEDTSEDGGSISADSDSNDQRMSSSAAPIQQRPGSERWLCPKLEVIHFTGSMFSDSAMLEFLEARTIYHQKYNVAHLKKASISFVFGREQESWAAAGLEKLERETPLRVKVMRYKFTRPLPRPKRFDYSPYDGLDSVSSSLNLTDYRFMPRNFLSF